MRCLEESLCRSVGQTITIITTSGNCFTGVLANVGGGCVRLITSLGAAPSCNSNSGWGFGSGLFGNNRRNCGCNRNNCRCGNSVIEAERGSNWLGSVTEIPVDKIASFTHHAI
ncbi:MAG: hypothetical protein FWF57_08050 [Defluviitaleaceae bacterium]|nr:hypothetical protein [Defluviitaleaceae bacterium]